MDPIYHRDSHEPAAADGPAAMAKPAMLANAVQAGGTCKPAGSSNGVLYSCESLGAANTFSVLFALDATVQAQHAAAGRLQRRCRPGGGSRADNANMLCEP
jgi:hypothetical protein